MRIYLSTFLFVFGFSQLINAQSFNSYQKAPAPGTIQYGPDLFIDRTEISNAAWLEYRMWLKSIFGEDSKEFRSAQSDTLVWSKYNRCLADFGKVYSRHPAYRDFPVVGVTQKQAEEFSKWRSDRVMEGYLIKFKIILRQAQDKDNYFTIEKYFNGKYLDLKPDPRIKYYPEYKLPSESEFKQALEHNAKLKGKYKEQPILDVNPCDTQRGVRIKDPVAPVTVIAKGKKKNHIDLLRGNVAEWTSSTGVCFGLSWIHLHEDLNNGDLIEVKTVQAWVGFRNVCVWKEWK